MIRDKKTGWPLLARTNPEPFRILNEPATRKAATVIEVEYDEIEGLATATIAGREVRFRGSYEAAEHYFRHLAERLDERGLAHSPALGLRR